MFLQNLSQNDPAVADIVRKELERQRGSLELIPSENFVSVAVLEALGSVLTNKYSEGTVGKRYYGGNQFIDQIEQLAIDRAKEMFAPDLSVRETIHVNVQSLSGAPANIAAYSALLTPGDTVLGMDLSHGGHLTHGHPVTLMAKIYNFIRYKTTAEGVIDYDEIHRLALEHKPKLILVGYSAYSREIDYQRVKEIADEVGALTMADIAHIAGLIVAGEMNNPVGLFDVVTTTTHKTLRGPRGGMIICKKEWAKKIDSAVFPGLQGGPHENNIAAKAVAFGEALKPEFKNYAKQIRLNAKALCNSLQAGGLKVMFGGTDNHLILADVTPLGLGGKEAQNVLDTLGITLNMNMIPDDPRSPMDPSGIRLGTPAMTTRGFKESDFAEVGEMIVKVLKNKNDAGVLDEVRAKVKELTDKYPLYPELK